MCHLRRQVNEVEVPSAQPTRAEVMGATDILKRLVDRVTRALTDASRNNPLIYYRDNRSTRFSLPPFGSDFVAKLLAGGTLSKQDFPATHAIPEAPTPSVAAAADEMDASEGSGAAARSLRGKLTAPVDPLQSRLQKIRAKAKENEEERGLPTLFVALGMKSPHGQAQGTHNFNLRRFPPSCHLVDHRN